MTDPPCDSPLAGQTIIVLGGMRSGTTWLVELLGAHSEIGTTTGESWIFHSLWDLWVNAHDPVEGLNAHLDQAEVVAAMRRFSDRMFSAAIARHAPGASWFVEKTPGQANRLLMMSVTHPDAWYIHLVRDARDVVRSILRTPWGYRSPGTGAADWVRAIRDVQAHAWRVDRFRALRYEDLIVDPVGEVGALFEWMGLGVDDGVEARVKERSLQEVSRFSSTDAVGIGKWLDLPPEALDAIYEEAGDVLVELGYVTDPR
ncbi:MAG: sulfotransferase [Acidimicrobiia bacterium]|nr:sulfotransferase [Acidimicrobiia bacterium]